MFDKLEAVEKRYEELTKLISDPEVISNQAEWQKLMKEHASIEEVVLKYREYKKAKQAMEEAQELMQDPEMKELAEMEYYENKEAFKRMGTLQNINNIKIDEYYTEQISAYENLIVTKVLTNF